LIELYVVAKNTVLAIYMYLGEEVGTNTHEGYRPHQTE